VPGKASGAARRGSWWGEGSQKQRLRAGAREGACAGGEALRWRKARWRRSSPGESLPRLLLPSPPPPNPLPTPTPTLGSAHREWAWVGIGEELALSLCPVRLPLLWASCGPACAWRSPGRCWPRGRGCGRRWWRTRRLLRAARWWAGHAAVTVSPGGALGRLGVLAAPVVLPALHHRALCRSKGGGMH